MDMKSLSKKMNIELSDLQLSQFQRYYELLIEWNEKINLTAITEYDDVIVKHFIDSIALINASDNKIISDALINDTGVSLIDVGCGAGFPSLPLKIAFPNLKVTMLDSLNKRINFLNTVIDELGLVDIEAVHGRAEDFAKADKLRESYDICVSRAVANLSTLSEYCLPYVKVGGIFVAYKSEELLKNNDGGSSELDRASKALYLLGGQVSETKEYTLPESDLYRCLCIVSKIKVTPKKYPRKAGQPSKDPL